MKRVKEGVLLWGLTLAWWVALDNQIKLFSEARISAADLDVKCANCPQDEPFPLVATLQS